MHTESKNKRCKTAASVQRERHCTHCNIFGPNTIATLFDVMRFVSARAVMSVKNFTRSFSNARCSVGSSFKHARAARILPGKSRIPAIG